MSGKLRKQIQSAISRGGVLSVGIGWPMEYQNVRFPISFEPSTFITYQDPDHAAMARGIWNTARDTAPQLITLNGAAAIGPIDAPTEELQRKFLKRVLDCFEPEITGLWTHTMEVNGRIYAALKIVGFRTFANKTVTSEYTRTRLRRLEPGRNGMSVNVFWDSKSLTDIRMAILRDDMENLWN